MPAPVTPTPTGSGRPPMSSTSIIGTPVTEAWRTSWPTGPRRGNGSPAGQYRSGVAWTAGGGDVATPPAKLEFSGPSATGPYVLAGLAEWVTDAIDNRGGRVIMRVKPKDEDPGFDTWWAGLDGANLDTDLVVTYEGADIAPVDDPGRATLGADRPRSSDGVSLGTAPAQPERPHRPHRGAVTDG